MGAKKNVVLPEATANYVSLFKARPPPNAKPGDENSYVVTLTFPKGKGTEKFIAQLTRDAEEVAEAQWPGKGKAVVKGQKYPIIADGDERLNGQGEPMFPGEYFIVAKRKESFGPPGVVNQRLQRIMDVSTVYSGARVFAQVTLFAYTHALGGRGVGVGLLNVQLAGDGPRRDGRVAPEEAFSEIEVEGGEDDADGLV